MGRLYLLPKIHKGLGNVPGSLDISNSWTAIERISLFFDFYIQPLVDCISFFIKDIKDFLRKWRGLSFVPDTYLIGTIDVVCLYPYISHCEGLETLRKAMEKENPKVPVGNIYNLAKLVWENNDFEFYENVYRHKLVQRLVLNLPLFC